MPGKKRKIAGKRESRSAAKEKAKAKGEPKQEPKPENGSKGRFSLIGISFISAGVLVMEVSMTRIFSFVFWYHYAFMMITVALLGFGVSGIFLTLNRRIKNVRLGSIGAFSGTLFAVSAVVALLAVTRLPFEPSQLGKEWTALFYLIVDFIILTVPFFFAGLLIASAISRRADIVNRVYFLDLIGAGTGCLITIALFSSLGGQGMVVLASVLGLCSALFFSFEIGKKAFLLIAAGVVVFIILMFSAQDIIPISPKALKGFNRIWLDKNDYPDAKVVFTGWNAYSRIDVVENTGVVNWFYNPKFQNYIPPMNQIIIDGDAATTIAEYDGRLESLAFLDVIPSALPYRLFHPRKALIIGTGGGVDIYAALAYNVEEVDAVEMNPLIVQLMTTRYAKISGDVYTRAGVHLHISEGRNFIRNSPDRYDLIQLTLIDTWAALSSGAYSLSENYLYTVEAFQDYYEHLAPGGVIVITRWFWETPVEALRLCTVGVEALKRSGVENPENHFAIYVMGAVGTVVISKDPFLPGQIEELYALCKERGFIIGYDPFKRLDTIFEVFISNRNREKLIREAPYDLSPVTDNKPFFFLFTRWKDINPFKAFQRNPLLAIPGKLILLYILALSVALSFILILLPLMVGKGGDLSGMNSIGRAAFPYLFYFFCIGVSFMFLEIYFMQKFTLLLGHPVYSLSLVLFSLLVFTGFGSLVSKKIIRGSPRRLGIALGLLAFLIVVFILSIPWIFSFFLGTPLSTRIILTLGVLLPISFLMGLPFPSGILLASRSHSGMIPWLWGMNSFASVISSSLCVLLAIEFGFSFVAFAAAAGYLASYAGITLSNTSSLPNR